MSCFSFSSKTCPKMSWPAAACGCLPSVLHSSDLPVTISGSVWEFLLFFSTLWRIFLLTSRYRAGPWALQSVSDTILWHVPQIKLALYSSGFSCLSAHFLLHNLLSLPAVYLNSGCLSHLSVPLASELSVHFSSCVLHCISHVQCHPFTDCFLFSRLLGIHLCHGAY